LLSIPAETYRRAQSAAWIDPEGEFEPITGEMFHDDLSAYFPGVPLDEDYPSNFAVENLGYVKVSNPFEMLWSGTSRDVRDRPINREAQFESMAQYTVGAIASYRKRGPPSWLNERGDPIDWEVRVLQHQRPISRTTVGDFVERYGSRETNDRLYSALGMNESRMRLVIRKLIRESLSIDTPKFIDDGNGNLILGGWSR
jgi:hypothetical protein